MLLSVEGPHIPDIRDAREQQNPVFEQLVNETIYDSRRNLVGEYRGNFC
jgi:hypothetical protein